jgi:tetratricopeptide (TPR) repeat protein
LIAWSAAACESVVPPGVASAVLDRLVRSGCDTPEPFVGAGSAAMDRYDFSQASWAFEQALARDPGRRDVRVSLARCWNLLRRPDDSLALFAAEAGIAGAGPRTQAAAHAQIGEALRQLGRHADAEAEFRAALELDPDHWPALLKLSKYLRADGRISELLALCEAMAAKGHRGARLLLEWGRASALTGDWRRAACLLADENRIVRQEISPPPGFAGIADFNHALADEVLSNPFPLSDFPEDEEANRGSSRVHHLMAGRRPELMRTLLRLLEERVTAHCAALVPSGAFDPWMEAMPARARLKPWALIQRDWMHEVWHTHPGGWLSGVYYIAVPSVVSADGIGRGCIEFGPPASLREAEDCPIPTLRVAPAEGMLILSPSHYHHRTIPSGVDEYRISFAFDVVPVKNL